MGEWQPIATALSQIRVFENLIERSAGIDIWGKVFVWGTDALDATKPATWYEAVYVDYGSGKLSYWKDARRTDDNYEIKPTHWMPLPAPPTPTPLEERG